MVGRRVQRDGLPRGYMAECARRAGVTRQAIDHRASVGWPHHALHENVRPPGETRPELVRVNAMFWGLNDEKSMSAKAREAGLSPSLVHLRIHNGWSEEKALSTPVQSRRGALRIRAEELGIKIGTVRMRMRHGWSEEEAVETPAYPTKGPRPGSLPDRVAKAGMKYGTVLARMRAGMSEEEALTKPVPVRRRRST